MTTAGNEERALPPLPEPVGTHDQGLTRQEPAYSAKQMHAYVRADRAALPEQAPIPHPGSPEASAMIDSVLAEYEWPSNAKNAARAGYVAASRLMAVPMQKHAGSLPEQAGGALRYIETDDKTIEKAYQRVDLSAVPHPFRASVAFELGWKAAALTTARAPVAGGALTDALERAIEFIADHEDVRDGSDGAQLPNRAMSLNQDLRLTLARTRR